MSDNEFIRAVPGDDFFNERILAIEKFRINKNAKLALAKKAMIESGSQVISHRILILVDLQGMYIAFHKWLSDYNFPMTDGLIASRFAHLQIERTFKEVTKRLLSASPEKTSDYMGFVESIKLKEVDGKLYLGEVLNVLKEGAYLDISPSYELFYAPIPLSSIEWRLKKYSRNESVEVKRQLNNIKDGVVSIRGGMERNYSFYDDFISRLKSSAEYSRSEEGFFNFGVDCNGLKYIDEKEVDTKIVIRAMDALYSSDTDSICIVSSDQDFIPLKQRADDFNVPFFQADLAKFRIDDNTGSRLRNMGDRFIQGGIDPSWPLLLLIEGYSDPSKGIFKRYHLSDSECLGLRDLYNSMNEVKIDLDLKDGNILNIRLNRPA